MARENTVELNGDANYRADTILKHVLRACILNGIRAEWDEVRDFELVKESVDAGSAGAKVCLQFLFSKDFRVKQHKL